MTSRLRHWKSPILAGLVIAATSFAASAQKAYDIGVTDTEIMVGNTVPYSGPASAYGAIGKTMAAYFRMVNDQGGINGRRINFISYDDGYNPAKTVEQVRKLVEGDEVFLMLAPLGTASNVAIQKYLNTRKVPQLFVASGGARWGDPQHFPWTMGWAPSYRSEARIYATYILKNHPNATIGILYQNDDFGKDYILGLRDVLGDKYPKMVIVEKAYEVTSPAIDSEVVAIKTVNPDIFLNIASPKFAAQAIKKIGELSWHPIQIMSNVSQSASTVMIPAGIEASKGVLSAGYQIDVSDPQWDNSQTMKDFRAFMDKYYPEADKESAETLWGYNVSIGFIQVLKQCGDNLTRANVMKQAANLDFVLPTLLPGARVKTSPSDFYPMEQLQMMRFTGSKWEYFGPLINSHADGG